MNEGYIKTPIELGSPDTKFGKAEIEAEARRKKYYKAEAEEESTKNSI